MLERQVKLGQLPIQALLDVGFVTPRPHALPTVGLNTSPSAFASGEERRCDDADVETSHRSSPRKRMADDAPEGGTYSHRLAFYIYMPEPSAKRTYHDSFPDKMS